jgi:hypothetical protein
MRKIRIIRSEGVSEERECVCPRGDFGIDMG